MLRNLKLLRGLDCRMNLIRFHAIPDVDLNVADMETMTAFRDYLTSHGLFFTIRSSGRIYLLLVVCCLRRSRKRITRININY